MDGPTDRVGHRVACTRLKYILIIAEILNEEKIPSHWNRQTLVINIIEPIISSDQYSNGFQVSDFLRLRFVNLDVKNNNNKDIDSPFTNHRTRVNEDFKMKVIFSICVVIAIFAVVSAKEKGK